MSVQTGGDVARFAADVRRALSGLGPEQVEDLTDGLEADLAEALADAPAGSDPVVVFGTPEEYAAELGAAAGLEPDTTTRRRRGLPEGVRHPIRAVRRFGATMLGALRRRPWWPPVEAFLVAVRPAWWVLRGWVVYQLTAMLTNSAQHEAVPSGLGRLGWLLVLVVLSVQWGRGRWRMPGRWRAIPMAVTTFAALAALPVLGALAGPQVQYVYQEVGAEPVASTPADGVYIDGMQVSNLFVYDAEGNPLDGVQVYDDRGRPVHTTQDEGQAEWYVPGDGAPWRFVGVADEDGRVRWNVYPLSGAHSLVFALDDATGQWVLPEGRQPQRPPRPFAKAPALAARDATGPTGDAVPSLDAGETPGVESSSGASEPTTPTESTPPASPAS